MELCFTCIHIYFIRTCEMTPVVQHQTYNTIKQIHTYIMSTHIKGEGYNKHIH